MLLVAQQPPYLPWAGFIDKVDQADICVLQDDLQYATQEWQNRNRIRTDAGSRWLSIPVHAHGSPLIREVRPADPRWPARHRRILDQWYGSSPFGERLLPLYEIMGGLGGATLAEINLTLTRQLLELLGVHATIVLESELELSTVETATPTDRLIALCRRLGCVGYLAGRGARNYLDRDRWARSGIELRWHAFALRRYEQLFPGWIGDLSVVDLLLCVEDPLQHIRTSRDRDSLDCISDRAARHPGKAR